MEESRSHDIQILNPEKGSVLAVYVDMKSISLENASKITQGIQKTFPDCKVIGLPMDFTFIEESQKDVMIESLEGIIEMLKSE